jgi:hyperosmotically inducible periplasmic protein
MNPHSMKGRFSMYSSGISRRFLGLILVPGMLLGLCMPRYAAGQTKTDRQMDRQRMERNIRHELAVLPYYTLFDNLEFRLEDDHTVVLSGQVVWAPLKDHAETAVKEVEGVEKIVNNIEILPVTPYDNTIRRRLYEAIYSQSGFDRYATQAVPPIHIIVKNGNVTLEGVVDDKYDKSVAEMAAKSVPNVFSVTNNLRIRQRE